jgi:hypothetical protein
MAYTVAFDATVKIVSAADAAGGDGREHVMLEPVGSDGVLLNGGVIKLVIDDAADQGKFVEDDVVAVSVVKS